MESLVALAAAACWLVVATVWIVAAIRLRAGPAAEVARPARRRARRVIAMVITVCLGLTGAGVLIDPPDLSRLVVPSTALQPIGLAVLVPSTAFTVWARLALGSSWTAVPAIVGDRRLRTTGPYGITRHPIYTGILGMVIGTAVVTGVVASLLAVVVSAAVIELKVWHEERLLTAAFPDEYPAYRRRVPQLVPGLAALRRSA